MVDAMSDLFQTFLYAEHCHCFLAGIHFESRIGQYGKDNTQYAPCDSE